MESYIHQIVSIGYVSSTTLSFEGTVITEKTVKKKPTYQITIYIHFAKCQAGKVRVYQRYISRI